MEISNRDITHLSFLMLTLLCFHVNTKAQDNPVGGFTTNPTDRILLQVNRKNLRIGVPLQFEQNGVFQVSHDAQSNSTVISGFCADVFQTAFTALDRDVSVQFIAVTDPNYNNLIGRVYTGEFDAVVGDVTITANRSRYVDFMLPYTDIGLGKLSLNADASMWIFMKPFGSDLWIVFACFFILIGFVVCILEHRSNEEFQGSPLEQIGTTLWFAFSTLVYAHTLELASSYTATLSSLLTIEQIRLASKGDSIGYRDGSFMTGYIVRNLNFKDTRLRSYSKSDEYDDALSRGGKNGGVDAIVDEIPYLKEILMRYPSGYSMVVSEMTTNGFGLTFPRGSPLVPELSRQISRLREDGTLKMLEYKWFKSDVQSMDSEPASRILDLQAYRGLFFISGVSMAMALFVFLLYFIHEKVNFTYTKLAGGKRAFIMKILYPTTCG